MPQHREAVKLSIVFFVCLVKKLLAPTYSEDVTCRVDFALVQYPSLLKSAAL